MEVFVGKSLEKSIHENLWGIFPACLNTGARFSFFEKQPLVTVSHFMSLAQVVFPWLSMAPMWIPIGSGLSGLNK